MIVALDTSVLIPALAHSSHPIATELEELLASGHPIVVPSLVAFEWLRGVQDARDRDDFDALFDAESIVPFGLEEATIAARLYRTVKRPRGREADIMIAATAISRSARLWTMNHDDFSDLPGLECFVPSQGPLRSRSGGAH